MPPAADRLRRSRRHMSADDYSDVRVATSWPSLHGRPATDAPFSESRSRQRHVIHAIALLCKVRIERSAGLTPRLRKEGYSGCSARRHAGGDTLRPFPGCNQRDGYKGFLGTTELDLFSASTYDFGSQDLSSARAARRRRFFFGLLFSGTSSPAYSNGSASNRSAWLRGVLYLLPVRSAGNDRVLNYPTPAGYAGSRIIEAMRARSRGLGGPDDLGCAVESLLAPSTYACHDTRPCGTVADAVLYECTCSIPIARQRRRTRRWAVGVLGPRAPLMPCSARSRDAVECLRAALSGPPARSLAAHGHDVLRFLQLQHRVLSVLDRLIRAVSGERMPGEDD